MDNSFPVCGTCTRLNLKCIRQGAKDVVPDAWATDKGASTLTTSSAASTQSTTPTSLCLPGAGNGCVDSPQKRQAMRYYISVLATYLTVSQEFNSFLTGESFGFSF